MAPGSINAPMSPRRAMVYALAQRYLAFIVQLFTSIVLARLLTPEETGVFSLAAAAVAIGVIMREFGTSDYLISQIDADRARVRAAYTVTVGIAWAVALALLLAAKPLAAAYNEPGVESVLHVLCLNFALVPMGSTAMALLTKEMRFDYLFYINSLSILVGATVTMGCAYFGLSYVSPAWGSVAGIATTVVILFIRQPSSIFMWPTLHGLTGVLRFGGTLTIARIIDGLASRAPDFIISGLLGFHATGLYSKASSLNGAFYEFFGSAVSRVAIPVIASARQQGLAVSEQFKQTTIIMASVQWLFFGFMIVAAPEIVLVLFGKQWAGAIPLLQLGAVGGILYAPFMLCQPLLTAFGNARGQLIAAIAFALALVVTMTIGSLYSLEAAVALTLLAALVRVSLLHRASLGYSGISIAPLLKALRPTAAISLVSVCASLVAALILRHADAPGIVVLAGSGAMCMVVFLILIAAANHPLRAELARALSALPVARRWAK